jgi:hypothetical protein
MSETGGPWQDGQRAWDRLAGWYPAAPSEGPSEGPKDAVGERALLALTDIGLVRRLLEHAELTAVRTARRQGKSWTEIAVSLGVTRQSAWERWRDVDDAASAIAAAGGGPLRYGRQQSYADLEAVLNEPRGRNVVVPDVVGMKWDDACIALRGKGLRGVGPDPNVPMWPHAVVTDQSPESGAAVPPGSSVTMWIDRGDSGVREPRRPKPEPRTGRKVRVQEDS